MVDKAVGRVCDHLAKPELDTPTLRILVVVFSVSISIWCIAHKLTPR